MRAHKKKKTIGYVERKLELVAPAPQGVEPFDQPHYAILIGLCFLSLLPTLIAPQSQWVNEDASLIRNTFVLRGQVAQIFSNGLWAGVKELVSSEPTYRPLFLLSLVPFAKNPFALRVLVWISHLALGLLLFSWLRRTTENKSRLWPLVGSGLFLLHPLGIEVKSQLLGLSETAPLLAIGIAFYLGARYSWAALLFAALAPGFKESGFFYLMGFTAYLFAQNKKREGATGVALIGGWAIAHSYALGGWNNLEAPNAYSNPLVALSWGEQLVSRFALAGQALRVLLFPTNPSCDYSAGTLTLPAEFFSLSTLGGVAVLAFLVTRWRSATKNEATWLTTTVLAASAIWNLHLLGYFGAAFSEPAWFGALFLLFLTAVPFLYRKADAKPLARRVALVFVAALALFYAQLDNRRQSAWVNSPTLYRTDGLNHPGNGRLQYNFGYTMGSLSEWPAAKQAFLETIRLYPDFPDVHYHLAMVYDALGEKENAKKEAEAARRLGFPMP